VGDPSDPVGDMSRRALTAAVTLERSSTTRADADRDHGDRTRDDFVFRLNRAVEGGGSVSSKTPSMNSIQRRQALLKILEERRVQSLSFGQPRSRRVRRLYSHVPQIALRPLAVDDVVRRRGPGCKYRDR